MRRIIKVFVDESPAGSGKTTRILQDITSRDGKFLFVVERIEQFFEVSGEIRKLWQGQKGLPFIVQISSRDGRRGSVSRKIEKLPSDHLNDQHVIVLTTHAALLSSDFSGFAGWEIIVDEVPPFLDFEQKQTHLDQAFFQTHYELDPVGDRWATVSPTAAGSALSVSDVRCDESHCHLAVFHRRVLDASRPGARRLVLCNLTSWAAMSDKNVQWCWASTFSLRELEAFERVTLLGNRFRADIGAKLSNAFDVEQVEWVELPTLRGQRQFLNRPVHIRYFSESRLASRTLFESRKGQQMLREIGSFLTGKLECADHIWSGNSSQTNSFVSDECQSVRSGLEQGGLSPMRYLSPRQAGTNAHMHCTHAAAIYSAKPAPNLINLLNALDIPADDWTRSVEHETILQFMTRTSLRDANNCSPVHLWVFDRAQPT